MKIPIKETFKDDFTTRDAGEKLRLMILASEETIILDFKGVKIASASFFDEGIGKLVLEGWKEDDFKNRIEFQNIFSKDLGLLKNACRIRGVLL